MCQVKNYTSSYWLCISSLTPKFCKNLLQKVIRNMFHNLVCIVNIEIFLMCKLFSMPVAELLPSICHSKCKTSCTWNKILLSAHYSHFSHDHLFSACIHQYVFYKVIKLIILHSSTLHVVLELILHLSMSSGAGSVPVVLCLESTNNFRAFRLFIKYLLTDCDIKGLE